MTCVDIQPKHLPNWPAKVSNWAGATASSSRVLVDFLFFLSGVVCCTPAGQFNYPHSESITTLVESHRSWHRIDLACSTIWPTGLLDTVMISFPTLSIDADSKKL